MRLEEINRRTVQVSFLSLKNTKTEHKCSVFLTILLKTNGLPISNRTLCSFSKANALKNQILFLNSLSHGGSARMGCNLSI